MVLSSSSPQTPFAQPKRPAHPIVGDSVSQKVTAAVPFIHRPGQDAHPTLPNVSPNLIGVHQWFEVQASQTPNQQALIGQSTSLTYAVLNQKANQLAHYLRAQGVGPDGLVAVTLERSVEMIIAFLGVLKAGGAYVPIDPAYPAERRAYMLKDANPSIILTQAHLVEGLQDQQAQTICLDHDWQTIATYSTENLSQDITAENLAYVIYTSGSTGNPKGVLIPHRAMMNHCAAIANIFELSSQDRVLQFSSMSFDIIIEEIYPTLMTGATLILRPDEISRSIRAFLTFVENVGITVLNIPTAFWHELVRGLEPDHQVLSPTVRLMVVGGEKVSRAVYGEWQKKIDHPVRWLNAYGPTETAVTATIYDPQAAGYSPEQGELPIGSPLPNLVTYVLDDQLQPLPVGVAGELYIGGAGLARGYLNLPEKTAERFIPDPFSDQPQARLYKTGDQVRHLADGHIEFIGRVDFQVKIRGFRIELGEIGSCLEEHGAVAQQVVLAREDRPGEKRLVAYLVLKTGQQADIQSLKAFMQAKLPAYMVPAQFVVMDELPLTTNGKVDRTALPVPVSNRDHAIVAPSHELEAQLVEIWQTVLEIAPLGVTDHFFELGGHSLLVARLFDALERRFNRPLPLTMIFEAPTIRQLAEAMTPLLAQVDESPHSTPGHSLVPLKVGDDTAPLFLVHDADGDTSLYLNLARHLKTNRSIYGLSPLSQADIPMVHTRIPEMAAAYLDQMRQVQPKGPYFLGGLCAGGVIAFEMALQLQRQGEAVELLALMEAPDVEAVGRSSQTEQRRDSFLQGLKDTLQQPDQPLLKRFGQTASLLFKKGWRFSQYMVRSQCQTASETVRCHLFRWFTDHHWPMPKLLKSLSVRTLYLFAEKTYCPQGQFQNPMVLFKATVGEGPDQPYHEVYADEDFGWHQRVTGPITIQSLPGGHSTMLAESHVGAMVNVLDQALA